MRAVVQRVKKSTVTVSEKIAGSIGQGLMVLLGVGKEDDDRDIEYLSDKILNLRIFEDENGKMNKSLVDIGGQLLVVSQFTLFGDCRKGRRPGFDKAAKPEIAKELYERFVIKCREAGVVTETGIFQADMLVDISNDGPVTLILDSKKEF
ncbi:D-aminoacyl-tRNA deacylase [Ruminiclostridium papyrosolvens]|uniref:D-aminoacyl-tRNA deacylase n=1 Tax=Ruminiclostridium papyrosolvens C7 TaxID=1330534 RepID=U4R3W1_9FIRM|nr:D-aminoacyl-tRNA deacylase [Ruminiclostridium papyrosolvens]EPR13174.1 D-tyrosyl-tRNA(Tyr) deacylase [Ruminiclostridium papyrosolvens C7]